MQTLNHTEVNQVSGAITFPIGSHPINPMPPIIGGPIIGGPIHPLPF